MDHTRAAEALLKQRADEAVLNVADWKASGLCPGSAAEGYAVQKAVAKLRTAGGDHLIGYKIGATNQTARDMLSVDTPFYGRLYERTTHSAPFDVRLMPGLHKVAEPEIAIRLGRDLDPVDAPFDAAAIRAATAEVLPVVEIVATSLDPWIEAGAPSLIADNGVHHLWIKGEARPDWDGFDPLEILVTATRAKGEPHVGKGAAVDGGAFGAAAWLANTLAEAGSTLKAGDYISTGTATPPIPLEPGDKLDCDFGSLGTVEVTISG